MSQIGNGENGELATIQAIRLAWANEHYPGLAA